VFDSRVGFSARTDGTSLFRRNPAGDSNERISETRYPINFVYTHTIFRPLTHMIGDWTLDSGFWTLDFVRVQNPESREGRFGENNARGVYI